MPTCYCFSPSSVTQPWQLPIAGVVLLLIIIIWEGTDSNVELEIISFIFYNDVSKVIGTSLEEARW